MLAVARLEDRDPELIDACETANQGLDVAGIAKDFDQICDDMPEPWE